MENPFDNQVILMDKPLDWTSFQVVKKVRWLTKVKKVGHAGTLDPRATGLLILCTGKKTKTIESIQAQPKTYTGVFKMGFTTPSYDTECDEVPVKPEIQLTAQEIKSVLDHFSGEIDQVPPIFSAVKVKGKRSYELARKGIQAELKPKKVKISSFSLGHKEGNLYEFQVTVSKGTYIRSLARDIGEMLGCGAYLFELRRTHIGEFKVEDAWKLQDFEEHVRQG
jgi:tRNA pseudouridine55 synthase